jgi:hypothetical protein
MSKLGTNILSQTVQVKQQLLFEAIKKHLPKSKRSVVKNLSLESLCV